MVKLGDYLLNIYHRIRKISPEKARELVREVYEENGRKIKRTARILGISKNTVKRAIRGPLTDLSRRPKRIKGRIDKRLGGADIKRAGKDQLWIQAAYWVYKGKA